MRNLIILSFCLLFKIAVSEKVGGTLFVQNDTVILKNDTLIRNILVKIDLNKYVGKSLRELLENDTLKQYRSYTMSQDFQRGQNMQGLGVSTFVIKYAMGLNLIVYTLPFDEFELRDQKHDFSSEEARIHYQKDIIKDRRIARLILDKSYFEESVLKGYTIDYFYDTRKIFSKGKMAFRGSSDKQVKVGEWATYYENGNVKSKENYVNGNLDGENIYYTEQGQIQSKVFYVNGIKQLEPEIK